MLQLLVSCLKILLSNLGAATIPFLCSCVFCNNGNPVTVFKFIQVLFFGLVYHLIFDISNQYTGYIQDNINHPKRRLIYFVGVKNIDKMKKIYYCACTLIFIIEILIFKKYGFTLWIFICIFHNDFGFGNVFIIKNLLLGTGVLPMGIIISYFNPIDITKIYYLTIRIMITNLIQDIKDYNGDKLDPNRETIITKYGKKNGLFIFILMDLISTIFIDFKIIPNVYLFIFCINIKIIYTMVSYIYINKRIGYDIYVILYVYHIILCQDNIFNKETNSTLPYNFFIILFISTIYILFLKKHNKGNM